VAPPSKDDVLKALKECYDPEINEKGRVDLNMTLTAVGCPVADWMRETVAEKIRSLPGVTEAYVNIVFDPPWSPQKLSPEGKDLLTAMGFPV
jgi:metal-sulfur cluster biosynthetic enzyme